MSLLTIISELEGQLNPDHSIDQPLDISSNPKSYELYLKAKSIDFVVRISWGAS